jgi:hypothetical protein
MKYIKFKISFVIIKKHNQIALPVGILRTQPSLPMEQRRKQNIELFSRLEE